ncbi:carboxypeptidase O-like [Rhinophrynus dorsalis]
MPFGLCKAPATFQHFVNDVFRDLLDQYIITYLDGILVFSPFLSEHCDHVKTMLGCLLKHGLYAKMEKCIFETQEIDFWGISPGCIKMDPRKITAIFNWPSPTDKKTIQRFIGFANFYHRFIQGFSHLIAPLTALRKNANSFQWSPEAQSSFNTLNQLLPKHLSTDNLMIHPTFHVSEFKPWTPSPFPDRGPTRPPPPVVHDSEEYEVQEILDSRVLIDDVQKLIDSRPVSEPKLQKISLENYDYTKYHPMEEIYGWMDLIKEKHGDLVSQHYIGCTYELRPIYYFKIGWPSDKTKKIIFIDCGFHAREWVSVAYCQWFVKEILSTHKNDPVLANVLKQVDFYVLPVLNIDGYIYSWTTDRLWRKNRSPHNNGTCYGVDLNRNFDSQWCTVGASKNCSSNIFCGSGPASEPETQAMASLIERTKADIIYYLTIHSYGQMILLPYGYKKDPSPHHEEMMLVAEKAVAKMKEKHNNEYIFGSSSAILYEDSGSSGDWAADIGIKFSYTFELRDNGTYGFVLPANQIKPTCEETMTAMMSMIEYVNENYLENSAMSVTSMWLNVLLSCTICMYLALIQ